MYVDNVIVNVVGFDEDPMCEEEIKGYISLLEKEHKAKLDKLDISPAEDGNVNLDYEFQPIKFHRIRRITGYLVGDINRWNNGKKAEEHDRVKHGISGLVTGVRK